MVVKAEEEAVNNYGDGIAWIRASIIGKGNFGRVYLATLRNPTSRNTFLPPVMAVKSAEVSSSGSIQKEREVYSNLEGSPYIINCFGDEITVGGNGVMAFNLLLEYAAGGTLADVIKKSGGNGMPELEARFHTRSILRGLRHIHELGYAHCDLKPDNVLLVRGGVTGLRAKIGDLGLAKRVKQSKKRKLGLCWEGTAMYLSPEAVVDHVQEAPSDVWAVGCIVLEMLTGKSALGGKKGMGAVEILRKIGAGHESVEIPNEVSKEARAFLKGCFVRNAKFRLTCEMLLNHPFLQGLVDDDEEDEDDELSENESVALVSGIDDEFISDSSADELSYGSEGDTLPSSANEDANELIYDLGEETRARVVGNGDIGFRSNEMSKHIPLKSLSDRRLHYPFSLTIPAGI
ncbi:hypothetical protein C2S51_018901 [Perilla frutescens var. frutescens]|nr:hypothetical protein C2S51_018901 [Perilla frutescens var. frutescens]